MTAPVTRAPARMSTISVAINCPDTRPNTVMSRATTSPVTVAVAVIVTSAALAQDGTVETSLERQLTRRTHFTGHDNAAARDFHRA